MTHPVKKIVIVGGGTAGWLTAGVIAAKHRSRMPGGFSITLVESPNIPTAGVGEGTWPTLRATLARMGVSGSEEHTSELQSLMRISYAVFCLKKKKEK